MTRSISSELECLEQRLLEIDQEKNAILAKIQTIRQENDNLVTKQHLTSNQKIKIFMHLFQGRTNVFPKRWDNPKTGKSGYAPACFNEWVRGICNKPTIKCSDCPNQAFIPLNETIIRKHLGGEDHNGSKRDYTVGIYPMLADDRCLFLAADFDKKDWQNDVKAFIETCRNKNIPYAVERSRSGNGAHVWIFFEDPIPAFEARRLGAAVITETMEDHPEIGLDSYDRFFPNQDTMPSGGFGNLIALPLQMTPRKQNNSVFLNNDFEPYADQWEFLSSINKMSVTAVRQIVDEASRNGNVLGIRIPVNDEEEDKPWDTKPSRKQADFPIGLILPKTILLVLSNQIFIEKKSLPPALINRLIRLAAFQNPEFYAAQAMRLSTFGKPRIIACAENFDLYIGLPRGCLEECLELLQGLGIGVSIDDRRQLGNKIETEFLGDLTNKQNDVVKVLLQHDTGVLSATTAFGKTVIGAYMIAQRSTNTLIIVHRKQLLEQWIERLKAFLNISSDQIGIISGGKYKPSNIIDIATIQSLTKNNSIDDIVENYGHIIVDECHHLSAVSFESVIRACKAKFILGLTATSTRKDGHQPIIFMQCGPIRYKVEQKDQAKIRAFSHKVITKTTNFISPSSDDSKQAITTIYSNLMSDQDRNNVIIDDVLAALKIGRSPLILTERKEHAAYFAYNLSMTCKNVILMVGGQSTKERVAIQEKLANLPDSEERLIIATGRYIGEGFDDKRLDTLFLTMPVSWHGTLAQYAGRLHRDHHSKNEVIIYDYIDHLVPMLSRMAEKRRKGYLRLGYSI
jgi:superfamily II DNA or RNA helicase